MRGISGRGDYVELLDQPGTPASELTGNLRDLRLLNRWLGWSTGVWSELRPLLRRLNGTAILLDVATGSGDVPRALSRRAARAGIDLQLIGTDVSRAVLADASRFTGNSLTLVQHDATALPFADASVDIATLCLAAHHLDPAQLVSVLQELARVCRLGIIVSDLERGRLAYVAARLMALVLRNRLTAHDGPVSVLRAYTVPELRALAREAGLRRVRVRRRFPFRMTLVGVR